MAGQRLALSLPVVPYRDQRSRVELTGLFRLSFSGIHFVDLAMQRAAMDADFFLPRRSC
jgi:hypothetical protein